ncbi:MAG TPA: DUF969 domain-containing protein [Candidatus Aquilonibacter sp.]|nr:DUF969 domain-containing protein [Candidatus Aquilonibacter sp.]
MIVLLGVLLVVIGFALRINPLLVVTIAGITSALLAGMTPLQILDAFGNGFANSRSVTIAFVVLPVIGLLERYGLQQRAKALISKAASLTAARILLLYLFLRQVLSAIGLTSVGGPAQMVRPLIYPMAEGAALQRHGELSEATTDTIKAHAAAADTIGVFFGEDCFVAVGSVLLIASYVDASYHLKLDPLAIAVWAIPTAIAAFLIHGFRLLLLDRRLEG